MYSRFRLAEKYLRYYLKAANGRGHGVHSPFVYDLVRNVLMDRKPYEGYAGVEELKKRLMRDDSFVEVEDLGAGSAGGTLHKRKIADIARLAAKPARLGRLLFRLVKHYRPRAVVELGTSLGLSSAYLAAGMAEAGRDGGDRGDNGDRGDRGDRGDMGDGGDRGDGDLARVSEAGVWTIEGSALVAERARTNLSALGLSCVKILTGNFDLLLEPLLRQIGPIDLAFVDGNHRFEPTLRYFDWLIRYSSTSAILVFDDIYWSAEMERAWMRIKADPRVMMTIDLFFFGIVVRRDEFKVKQDFTIRF